MYVMLYHYVYYMFMAIGSFAGRRVLFLKKWCADFPDRPPFLDRGKDRKHGEIYGTYMGHIWGTYGTYWKYEIVPYMSFDNHLIIIYWKYENSHILILSRSLRVVIVI